MFHSNGRVYTTQDVSTAFSKAADELPSLAPDQADVGHLSDALVVVAQYFLSHPEASVEEAIAAHPAYEGMTIAQVVGGVSG